MNMITLYGEVTRTRANRCSWMLSEIAIDYSVKPFAFRPGESKPAVPIADIDISPWPSMKRLLHHRLSRAAAIDTRSVSFKGPRPAFPRDIFAMFVQRSFDLIRHNKGNLHAFTL